MINVIELSQNFNGGCRRLHEEGGRGKVKVNEEGYFHFFVGGIFKTS